MHRWRIESKMINADKNTQEVVQFLLRSDIQELVDDENYKELYRRADRVLHDDTDNLICILTKILVDLGIDINKIISQLGNKIPEHFAYRLDENIDGTKLPDSLEISDNITTIEAHAFAYCEQVKGVHFSGSVKKIGESAFEGCIGFEKLDLNKVDTVGMFAFEFCEGLKEIKLPNITTIKSSAFHGCVSLEKIYMHLTRSTTVYRIGYQAFASCKSLRDVYLDNDVHEFNAAFSDTAFDGCKNVTIHCTDSEFMLRSLR